MSTVVSEEASSKMTMMKHDIIAYRVPVASQAVFAEGPL